MVLGEVEQTTTKLRLTEVDRRLVEKLDMLEAALERDGSILKSRTKVLKQQLGKIRALIAEVRQWKQDEDFEMRYLVFELEKLLGELNSDEQQGKGNSLLLLEAMEKDKALEQLQQRMVKLVSGVEEVKMYHQREVNELETLSRVDTSIKDKKALVGELSRAFKGMEPKLDNNTSLEQELGALKTSLLEQVERRNSTIRARELAVEEGTWRGLPVRIHIVHARDTSKETVKELERWQTEYSKHANLCKLYGTSFSAGRLYIVAESDGRILEDCLYGQSPMLWSIHEKRGLMYDVCSGLGFLHERNILHRSITPSHISYKLGQLKLHLDPIVLKLGVPKMDERYLPPEAFSEDSPVWLHQSDMYMVAITSWEIVEHRKPFESLDREAMVEAKRMGQEKSVLIFEKNLDIGMESLINQCWSFVPVDRAWATEICSLLETSFYLESLQGENRDNLAEPDTEERIKREEAELAETETKMKETAAQELDVRVQSFANCNAHMQAKNHHESREYIEMVLNSISPQIDQAIVCDAFAVLEAMARVNNHQVMQILLESQLIDIALNILKLDHRSAVAISALRALQPFIATLRTNQTEIDIDLKPIAQLLDGDAAVEALNLLTLAIHNDYNARLAIQTGVIDGVCRYALRTESVESISAVIQFIREYTVKAPTLLDDHANVFLTTLSSAIEMDDTQIKENVLVCWQNLAKHGLHDQLHSFHVLDVLPGLLTMNSVLLVHESIEFIQLMCRNAPLKHHIATNGCAKAILLVMSTRSDELGLVEMCVDTLITLVTESAPEVKQAFAKLKVARHVSNASKLFPDNVFVQAKFSILLDQLEKA